MSEFFWFKYMALDTYNEYYFELGYTHAQAADRCIYEFKISMTESVVREIAVYTTVLYQFVCWTKDVMIFNSRYKHLMELCNSVSLESLLNKDELEYLEDELSVLKEKFEN